MGGVGYKCRLAVKHGHLGRLQHVASLVALCGLHKKEHFDVAENREAHVGGCVGVESAEDGSGTSDRAMIKWDVEVAGWEPATGWRKRDSPGSLFLVVAVQELLW